MAQILRLELVRRPLCPQTQHGACAPAGLGARLVYETNDGLAAGTQLLLVQRGCQDVFAVRRELHKGHWGVVIVDKCLQALA